MTARPPRATSRCLRKVYVDGEFRQGSGVWPLRLALRLYRVGPGAYAWFGEALGQLDLPCDSIPAALAHAHARWAHARCSPTR
jgi:hypothetical protein